MSGKKFILRVETSRGRKRMTFDSGDVTFREFQSQLEKEYGVAPDEQILSRRPPANPDFIEASNPDDSLKGCGLKHGDLIYFIMGKNHLDNFMSQQRQARAAQEDRLRKNANVPAASNGDEKQDMKVDSNDNGNRNSNYQLPSSNTRKIPNKITLDTSKWVNDPKHKIEDNGPKHVPFHKWIEDRQKKYANQPWNIDPPKFDYRC